MYFQDANANRKQLTDALICFDEGGKEKDFDLLPCRHVTFRSHSNAARRIVGEFIQPPRPKPGAAHRRAPLAAANGFRSTKREGKAERSTPEEKGLLELKEQEEPAPGSGAFAGDQREVPGSARSCRPPELQMEQRRRRTRGRTRQRRLPSGGGLGRSRDPFWIPVRTKTAKKDLFSRQKSPGGAPRPAGATF